MPEIPVNALGLEKLIEEYDLTAGAEIGVRRGELTSSLVQRFPNLTMIACDIWDSHPSLNEHHPHDSNLSQFMNYIRGNEDRVTVLKMLSTEGAKEVEDESLDFIFIDATHTYDAVKLDLAAWLPKLKPTGFVCGHDYCDHYSGVKAAVDEIVGMTYVFTENNHKVGAQMVIDRLKSHKGGVADSRTGCWYCRKSELLV